MSEIGNILKGGNAAERTGTAKELQQLLRSPELFGARLVDDGKTAYCCPEGGIVFGNCNDLKQAENSEHNWFKTGSDDNHFGHLRQYYRDVAIHKSALEKTALLMVGAGLEFIPAERQCRLNAEGQYEYITNSFASDAERETEIELAELFAKNVALNKYWHDASLQTAIYGGYYGLKDYMLDAAGMAKLDKVRVESYFNMRLGHIREWANNDYTSTRFYISRSFSGEMKGKYSGRSTITRQHKVYDYEQYKIEAMKSCDAVGWIPVDDGTAMAESMPGTYCRHVANISDYMDYYATPHWLTNEAQEALATKYMLGQKRRNDVQNGFSLDHIIVRYRMKKSDKEEAAEKEKDVKEITENYKGVVGKKLSILWVQPRHNPVTGQLENRAPIEIITIPRQEDTSIKSIIEETYTTLLTAHSVPSPAILGLPVLQGATGLSNQAEWLRAALEQYYYSVCQPAMKRIEEDINNMLISADLRVTAKGKKSLPTFLQMSDKLLLSGIWHDDEVRAKFNDEPMPEQLKAEVAEAAMNGIMQAERQQADDDDMEADMAGSRVTRFINFLKNG